MHALLIKVLYFFASHQGKQKYKNLTRLVNIISNMATIVKDFSVTKIKVIFYSLLHLNHKVIRKF